MAMSVDDYVQSKVDPRYHALAEAVRGLLRECAPDATEMVSYNMPVWVGRKIFAYFMANQQGITLGFTYGMRFNDRYGLLRGTGKWSRHLKLKDASKIPAEAIRDYVRQAQLIDREGMPASETEQAD